MYLDHLSHNWVAITSHELFEPLLFSDPSLFFLLVCSDLSSQIFLLRLDEGINYDSEDKVEKEELPDKDHQHAVDPTKDWILYVHHVAHHLVPCV